MTPTPPNRLRRLEPTAGEAARTGVPRVFLPEDRSGGCGPSGEKPGSVRNSQKSSPAQGKVLPYWPAEVRVCTTYSLTKEQDANAQPM